MSISHSEQFITQGSAVLLSQDLRVGDEEFWDSNKVSPSIVDAQRPTVYGIVQLDMILMLLTRKITKNPPSLSLLLLPNLRVKTLMQVSKAYLPFAPILMRLAAAARNPEAIRAAVMLGLEKIKGYRKRSANESSDESDEEESESSDSDYDSKIERAIAKKYGKGLTSKLKSSRKKRDNDDFDEDDLDSKDKIKRGRSKKRSVKRRRRSHPHSDDSDRRKEGHRGKTGINYYPNEMFSLEKVSLAVLFDLKFMHNPLKSEKCIKCDQVFKEFSRSLISWKSKKQNTTAKSFTEAECRALASVTSE
ncbi:hypothetical protein Tco_1192382, partial [Tanacetum coccineum]